MNKLFVPLYLWFSYNKNYLHLLRKSIKLIGRGENGSMPPAFISFVLVELLSGSHMLNNEKEIFWRKVDLTLEEEAAHVFKQQNLHGHRSFILLVV